MDQFLVKVVGGVGNEINPDGDQLKIGHYWDGYDKSKTKSNFKEETLIEAVRYCRQSSPGDWATNYKFLLDCILRVLRMLGKRDKDGKYFSYTSMRDYLMEKEKWNNLRQLTYVMLDSNYRIDLEFWNQVNKVLASIFDIKDIQASVKLYLSYSEGEVLVENSEDEVLQDEEALVNLPDNMILHPDGFHIELSTIHGVKGETHDATLILETKNHCFDLGVMMPYLTGELPSDEYPNVKLRDIPHWKPDFKSNKKFMRQFYVAMSRPKHLLCLAVHKDRITSDQKDKLIHHGWVVQDLN